MFPIRRFGSFVVRMMLLFVLCLTMLFLVLGSTKETSTEERSSPTKTFVQFKAERVINDLQPRSLVERKVQTRIESNFAETTFSFSLANDSDRRTNSSKFHWSARRERVDFRLEQDRRQIVGSLRASRSERSAAENLIFREIVSAVERTGCSRNLCRVRRHVSFRRTSRENQTQTIVLENRHRQNQSAR